MNCQFAIVNFCKPTPPFWELHTVLTREMCKNMCYPVFFVTVSNEGGWKGACWGNIT
jgi:hypothetical protein